MATETSGTFATQGTNADATPKKQVLTGAQLASLLSASARAAYDIGVDDSVVPSSSGALLAALFSETSPSRAGFRVQPGFALIQGHWYRLEADAAGSTLDLEVSANTFSAPRKWRLFLRLARTENRVRFVLRSGSAANPPPAPQPQNTAEQTEFPVATAQQPAGALAMEQLQDDRWFLTRPMARVFRSTSQAIPHDSTQRIVPDSATYRHPGMWDSSANPGRLTAVRAGIYDITVQTRWTPNTAGRRFVQLRKTDGGDAAGGERIGALDTTGPHTAAASIVAHDLVLVAPGVRLSEGDYVSAYVYQNSGASLDLSASGPGTHIVMTCVG